MGSSRHINPTSNIVGTGAGAAAPQMVPVEPSWPSVKVADSLMGQLRDYQSPTQPWLNEHNSVSVDSSRERLECGNFLSAPASGRAEASHATEENDDDDEDFDSAEEVSDHKSTRQPARKGKKGKERRRVGRPVAYQGDPDAPELSEKERRRIKRRIANRESAQRVRHRRQEELEEMQLKMDQVMEENSQLRSQVEGNLQQRNQLANELGDMRGKFQTMAANNVNMDAKVQALRQSLQLKMSALESELEIREAEVDPASQAPVIVSSGFTSVFGTTTVKQEPSYPSFALPPGSRAFSSGLSRSMEMKGSQGALDWFPSLNLDGLKSMDMDYLLDLSYNNGNNPNAAT
jgi:hypothetical protein